MAHSRLEDEVAMFQSAILCRMDEKSWKIYTLENTMESIFQNLVDKFEDKKYLVDDLEEEVKTLSHEDIVDLKEINYRLE